MNLHIALIAFSSKLTHTNKILPQTELNRRNFKIVKMTNYTWGKLKKTSRKLYTFLASYRKTTY